MDDLSLVPQKPGIGADAPPSTLIPQDDYTKRMVQKYSRMPAAAPAPVRAAAPAAIPAAAPVPTGSGDAYTDAMVRKYGGAPARTPAPVPEKPIGLSGTLKQGIYSTGRSLGATADTVQGDEAEVVSAAKAAQKAPQDPKFTALMGDIAARQKALGDDPGWLDSLKAVGGAVADNPMGTVHLIAGQLPNAAVALGAGAAGAAAGSIAGPVGTVIGGIAGLFSANSALEVGSKAIDAATDGSFDKEEQRKALKEGTVKGAVITGVDAATLGLTKWITNTTGRAMNAATAKVLADNGVDVNNRIAMQAARDNPAIVEAVQTAQKAAQKATDTLGRKLSHGTAALALESLGEGTGEYLGEYAATGQANKVDAIIEAVSSLGQSAGEVAITNSLNKKALARLFGSKAEADAAALADSKSTGIPHVAEPSPTDAGKFVAVPKARSTSGLNLEQDADGNLTPTQPKSTQTAFNLANKPGFLHSAEDKIQQQADKKAADASYAANPIITPTIGGAPVTGLSNSVLAYSATRGSMRVQAAAAAELERRRLQGVDPTIADAPESTIAAVNRIISTGRERSQEVTHGKVAPTPSVAPDSPTPEPEGTLAAQLKALSEGRKPGVLLTPGEAHPETLPNGVKTADIPGRGTLLYRDDATLQHALAGRMGQALGYGVDEKPGEPTHAVTARDESGTVIHDVATDADGAKAALDAAAKVAGPDGTVEERPVAEVMAERAAASKVDEKVVQPAPKAAPVVTPKVDEKQGIVAGDSIRPLVEALIKRHAAAHQVGKGSTFSKVLEAAKALLRGDAVLPARFKSAAAILKHDPVAVGILNSLHEKALAAQKAAKAAVSTPVSTKKTADTSETSKTSAKTTPAALDTSASAVRARLKSDKAFKAAYVHANEPHPESGPAGQILRGWLDAEAERPMDEAQISRPGEHMRPGGFNPVDYYRTAYLSRQTGKPVVVRTMEPATTPAASEKSAGKATKKAGDARAALEAHFAPGNVISSSYRREHDRVVSFDWNNGDWHVKVEKVKKDADGNWQATERARTHSTYPDKKDVVVEHAKLKQDIQDFVDGKTATVPDVPPPVPEKATTPDPKKAQATRKKAERDLHLFASTNPDLMNMAGTMDLQSFTEGVNEALAQEVTRIANEYGGPEKDAVLALVADGKAVLPKEFYASAYKAGKAAWEEQQKIDARDPQVYRDTLDWGMGAAGIDKTGDDAAQYKQGFDHALKGKTKSTLPQDGKQVKGYEDARAWIKTSDGKAWFEGKRLNKQKSTGEALKRRWERVRKDIESATAADMKKAWATILKATTRGDLFPVELSDTATPGAKAWLADFRSEIATFQDYYTREMIDQQNSGKRYYANASDVFMGKYTSSSGRASALDYKDEDATAELAADREKARQAVIALYEDANKESAPDAAALAAQREVIADEKRWFAFGGSMAHGQHYKNAGIINDYFRKIDKVKRDKARLALTKQIALEYQTHLSDLAAKFQGVESLADIKKIIEDTYGQPGKYVLGSKEAGDTALYQDNRTKIKQTFPADEKDWDYKYSSWKRLAETENTERQQGERKDTLMRPRLDRITRNMPDVRKGRSITAAEFKKAFGFADVTIGEYVTAKEAEDHLNYAYDAFQSLALMLGAKPTQLSFGGTLHFSIGALGHGKYAAHFQPSHEKADGTRVPVINVTKTRGDGSVLHEYFHAIDFLTTDPKLKAAINSVKRLLKGTPKTAEQLQSVVDSLLSGRSSFSRMGKNSRPKDHVLYGLRGWYRAGGSGSMEPTDFYRAALELDKGAGSDPYWSNDYEPWARAAESWGFDRMQEGQQRDDYLQSDWVADGKVTKKTHRGTPYPLSAERKRLNALMETFTQAIEWTDAGPNLKADHVWQKELPFDGLMQGYRDAVQHVTDNIDEMARNMKERLAKEAQARAAERDRLEKERIFGKPEEKTPPPPPVIPQEAVPEPVVPTPSSEPEGDAPLSEDELSSIFDEVAEAARESTQDKPDAPEPGEKLDAQAWSREDVFHIINLVMQGRMVLLSGEKFAKDNGLPTIHDFQGKAEVKHFGYGVFEAKNADYTVTWIGGSGMDHTPGGRAYTVAAVTEGKFPYPKDDVLNALHSIIGTTPANKPEAKTPPPAAKPGKTPAPAKTPKAAPLPDLEQVQEKTAAILAAEFAKHGVKGIDKTLEGLVKLFGGGPNKLQSFPGGFDEKTYAQAKTLFKEAAEEFRASGVSFKEFVRLFFRALISQFGDGVKPYAVRFAKEYQDIYDDVDAKNNDVDAKNNDVDPAPVDSGTSPSVKLSDWVLDNLTAGRAMTWQELFAQGDKAFSGTQAEGKYTPKDAYDAVELGINRYLFQEHNINPAMIGEIFAQVNVKNAEKLLELVPTQTKRTAEQDEFQQFSTPPHFAFIANWVANLKPNDTYFEPSAGVGGLAVFAKIAGVNKVIVNELSARRLALLQTLPFDAVYAENGEQLSNVLPQVHPTVIVMNPPFSATGGRMQGSRDTMNGAVHIEQALKMLNPGGRLVAIVGEGMAADRPAFLAWWNKIRKEYNVRANIGVSGASYAKYGTTFDNQILVIDKNGPTTGKVITGKVDHPADAIKLLAGVQNDRPIAEAIADDSDVSSGTGSGANAKDGRGAKNSQSPGTADAAGVGGGGKQAAGGSSGTGHAGASNDGGNQSPGSSENTDQSGRGRADNESAGTNTGTDQSGNKPGDFKSGEQHDPTLENSVFEPYTPKKVRIEGAVKHNTPLVESSAMASVSPPDPTYTPDLTKKLITNGLLSDAQLEAVVYAGQAHAQMGRDGLTRRGFFIGDGTGVGKGREISGIILDNMRQGRTKAIWLSKKKELLADAKRDFGNIGGNPDLIFPQAKHKHNDPITPKAGILFTAYPTMRSQSAAGKMAQTKAGKQRVVDKDGISFERVRQIVAWVGKDFDGVIAFDESHEMGNAIAMKGARGNKDPSQQALAGLELQKALPNARVVYVSATGATEVQNLAYAPRLGLWGDGTPFADVTKFVDAMSQSVSAMELVAQNLKQMGLYTARSLSYDGVTYEQLLHTLTPYQRETYDLLAGAWQVVLANIDAAMEKTGVTKSTGDGAKVAGRNAGKIKGAILAQFWGAHQRFFNQIVTASQMPSILEQIDEDLKNGMAVVLQLTNTNEAGQNRALGAAAAAQADENSEEEAEELDLTPREQLVSFLEKSFPTAQFEKYLAEDGKTTMVRPVKDSKGFPVVNREAVALRDEMIKNIRSIRIPDSPLQMLFDKFGSAKIAEITGRTKRITRDDKGKIKVEKRGPAAVAVDSDAFKDGKKNILVFSGAGGTGFSFHSDRTYKNRKQRAHYIVQAGWSADKAVQGFGRTHRTNQENAPVYRLAKTDIPAHARFISSIARRLEQLGALTAGQRDTAGGSIFSASDNLESTYAAAAVRKIFTDIARGHAYPGQPADLLDQMGLSDIISPDTGGIAEAKLPTITKFLNRLLSVRLDTQKGLFDHFMAALDAQVQGARQMGTFDDGLETIKNTGAKIVQEKEVYRDPSTNAEVRYLEIKYTTPNVFYDFDDTAKSMEGMSESGWFRNKVSGRVAAIRKTSLTKTLATGVIDPVYAVSRTGGTSYESYTAIRFDTFERIRPDEARALWEKENAVRPKDRQHDLHMVVGGILPLWDRFNAEHVQVVRIALSNGQRLLGRKIAAHDLKDTLQKLDVKSSTAKMTGRELMQQVLDGNRIELSNGWGLKQVRVSNQQRVELTTGRSYMSQNQTDQIISSGAFYERIQYQPRYFIPAGLDAGGKAIDALLKKLGANATFIHGVDEAGTATPDDEAGVFSRSTSAANSGTSSAADSAGLKKHQVQSIVDAIRARWKNAPQIVILDSMDDAPPAVKAENDRQLSKGATGNPEGFAYGGKVYIVASQMRRPGDVVRVLLHESLGHFGLRGVFGNQLHAILKQVAALRRGDVTAKAKQYGLNMDLEADRLIAAEEVLAEMAQANPQSNFVRRAIAAIRTWLRDHVPGFKNMMLSDGEIINNYLIPARQFVQQGRAGAAPGGLAGAFSRESDIHAVNATVNGQIEQWGRGKLKSSEILQLGRPSEILRLFGIPDLPIHLTQSVLVKAVNKKHEVEVPDLNDIALNIQAPMAVFKSKQGDGHIILVTEARHRDGNIVVALDLDVTRRGIQINDIRSVYPKRDKNISHWIEDGALLGYEKRKGRNWLENSAATNTQQLQAKAALDGAIVYDTDSLRNPPMFSRSSAANSSTGSAAPAAGNANSTTPVRDKMDSMLDAFIYNFQDRFKPLKDIQRRAGAVPETMDAALAEERYSGMTRARTDDFEAEMREPLIKAIHDSGVAYEDVEEYLHALHAPSRNAAMREINPTKPELEQQTAALTAKRDALAQEGDVREYMEKRRELRAAEADIEDGIADESLGRMLTAELATLRKSQTVKDWLKAKDKLAALGGVKPFDGDNTALSGMSNDEAAAVIAKAKANGTETALKGISARVNAITSKTRDIFVESGLEKADTIAAWNSKYENYVPLHRDEVGSGTGNHPIGQGFNIRGRESKRATGSTREVTHILAHVVAQHEAAIIRSEKTKVDQALFALAKAHPDPKLWTLDTADTIRTTNPVTGLVESRVDPLYKNRPNVLSLKIDGEEHTITFTESNPEGMRLVASMKNLTSQEMGDVTRVVGKFTRFLATMSTTANPVFLARNFLRDLQTSFVNLSDTELAGKKKQVFNDVPAAIKGMWKLSRGDKSSTWAKFAAEFKAAGGQTGWMEHYKDIGTRADSLKKELATMGPGKLNLAKRTASAWWNVVEDANNAVENGVRLAAYVHARRAGLSEGKAASLAKNLTVNFNAHGAKGVELNAWYMFMNASIQGTARLVKALSNPQVRRIVAGVILSGFLLDILARSMAGDDDEDGENDYDQLPEYTKAMNFVFMVDGRPVTIPQPYGYNFFASLGRKMSELIFRDDYSAVQGGIDLTSAFFSAFSPVGQAGSMLQVVAPTVADPFLQWSENKNFAGNPLRREQHPFGSPNPEYQMGFKSTSAPAKWLAQLLNDETGGNEVRPGMIDVNPALFDFAVASVAGGAGKTYLQALSLPMKMAGDEDIQAREVPFVNILLSAKPEQQVENKYFTALKKVELVKGELKNYKGNAERVAQIRADHGNELKLVDLASYTQRKLTGLRKRDAVLDKTDPPNRAELKKANEEKRHALMSHFNKRYREAIGMQ